MNAKGESPKGFSLLETMAVMSLIAVLAVSAIPALTDSQSVSLDGAAHKVEGDLRYAQSLAMTTGDGYGFRTLDDGTATTYEVYDVVSGDVVSSPYDHQPMQEDLKESFEGVEFQNNEAYDIRFDEQGTPTIVAGDSNIELTNTSDETSVIAVNDGGLISIQ